MKTQLFVACAPGLLSFFAFSCSSPDLCVDDTCGADGGEKDGGGDATLHEDGASDGGSDADSTVIPPGCDPTGDLAMQSACVTETDGFFVDSTAAVSSAKGTRATPFATIQAAVNATSGAKPNVFVCAGNYPEQVQMTKSANLYGGFDCGTWVDSKLAVTVKPSGAGYALQMTGVSASIVEDVELDSQDGANPGDSSVAVFASGSTATFRRVRIVAGNAGSTPDAGAAGSNYSNGATAPAGAAADGGAGGITPACPKCGNGEVSTGAGGGGSGMFGGSPGGNGMPTIPAGNNDGLGGAYNTTKSQCEPGDNGSNSFAGLGGHGAANSGVLTAAGWASSGGAAGATAHVAQGGGGGSGGVGTTSGAGGGGGCGGCGGAGGAGGQAGGSSFAVLSFQSTLTFDSSTLSSGVPANGGPGGAGEAGQLGGNGGVQSSPGCPGGGGGAGGEGAGGGGGAAGLSIDVGFVGLMPNLLSTTTATFSIFAAAGGVPGSDGLADGGAGITGSNGTMLPLPTQ